MSRVASTCQKFIDDCRECLEIVYYDHNPDPLCKDEEKQSLLTKEQFDALVELGVSNEMTKTTRGNGERQQCVCAGIPTTKESEVSALAEAPSVNDSENRFVIKQQHNQNIGFAPGNASTWMFRQLSDHMRREKPTMISDLTFNHSTSNNNNDNNESKYQYMKGEPMKMNLKPDWDCKGKNFINGSKLCYYFSKLLVWVTRSYFEGSMIESLADPRQITMIIVKGNGIVQTAFGLLKFTAGDLVQIPQNTPFRVFVQKGSICETINYYSKESLIFPDAQLNVSDVNQVPFMASSVFQCKYFYNESRIIPQRSEYVRVEQFDHEYKLFHYKTCKNGFNFDNYCHYGPLPHKVNLVSHFERIGTSIGHKDPNIWLILRHRFDASFGIAFITGESFIVLNNCNRLTYPPAYLHLNGVHELGELVKFESDSQFSYDARKSTSGEGQCLVHCAGVGHGGDAPVMKQYVLFAMIKYFLQNEIALERLSMAMKTGKNENENENVNAFLRNCKSGNMEQKKRISEMIKYVYSIDNSEFKWDETKHKKLEDSVWFNMKKVISIIVNGGDGKNNSILNEKKLKFAKLGMPFGIGYLLLESRDAPAIPHCDENSNFRHTTDISYGVEVGDVVREANQFLSKVALSNSKL